jgi:geranylgeranyl diphosphate synthase, type II
MSQSATVEETPVLSSEAGDPGSSRGQSTASTRDRSGRSTSHLKLVPETLDLREYIKREAERFAAKLDKSRPFTKAQLEQHGRSLLAEINQPEKFLGFTMVMIGNFFWKKQFLALPFNRRMLLLPHCLKHADGCPADYDEFGLDCEKCGACSIADYKVRAEQLGYKVLVAEGSPVVLKIIVSGHIDGILGVACLNVLEKAIDKVLIAGVPSYAVPLHSGDCKNTKLDETWVWECLDKYEPETPPQTASYIPLMRRVQTVFETEFESLFPAGAVAAASVETRSPLAFTAGVAHDWLRTGGKRLRPFVTLAAYDALTGGHALVARGEGDLPAYGPEVLRVAMAIEAFHKASLVHDDIEDGDEFRYGRRTIHHEYSLAAAINVGDYLIGLGYRLISANRGGLPTDVITDVLDRLAGAHVKLCDGQGAELQWTTSKEVLTPLEAMKIYALKTSPAFEAALYAGLRLAGPVERYESMLTQFCKHIGVGFQILNDLQDWNEHESNKRHSARDAETAKPTLLVALAAAAATPAQRAVLDEILRESTPPLLRAERLRRLFKELGVFDQARALVEKCRARAEALADETEPETLRQLLYFLTDTILAEASTEPPSLPLVSLAITPPAVPA